MKQGKTIAALMPTVSAVAVFFLCWLVCGVGHARYASQTIDLHPGWNAIFLEVDPPESDPAVVFGGLPVESVWRWNPSETFVQYIDDPEELTSENPDWLAWFSNDHEHGEHLTTLHAIAGETAYLIKISGGSDVQLTVVGVAKLPRVRWKPQSMNLAGFHVKEGQGPTFADFFKPSDAHGADAVVVYGLNAQGTWNLLDANTTINAGEAYWVKCNQATDYTGPLSVEASSSLGLDFGTTIVEQDLGIVNHSAGDVTVTVTQIPSSSSGPSVDGMIPLSHWVRPPAANAGWNDFNGPIDLVYEAGKGLDLKLAVRRTDLPGPGVYQSLLEIDNNAGVKILAPVRTGESSTVGRAPNMRASEPEDGPPERTGLWVGVAAIDHVNQPALGDDPGTPDVNEKEEPRPTDSEFNFRLIVHVDENGTARLLREVYQLWKSEILDDQGEVVEEGRQVLITDNSLLDDPEYTGVGIRDGRLAGRRISTAVYSFDNPLDCVGVFDLENELTASYTIGYDDPLNPYKHKFHPDHDNLDRDFQDPREEAYEISRSITMTFTETDPTNLSLVKPGWGDTVMGGEYRERIEGLHKETMVAKGYFRLTKVSELGVLNDQ